MPSRVPALPCCLQDQSRILVHAISLRYGGPEACRPAAVRQWRRWTRPPLGGMGGWTDGQLRSWWGGGLYLRMHGIPYQGRSFTATGQLSNSTGQQSPEPKASQGKINASQQTPMMTLGVVIPTHFSSTLPQPAIQPPSSAPPSTSPPPLSLCLGCPLCRWADL
jgi:hypothetical protein